jgi:hypothetical protein
MTRGMTSRLNHRSATTEIAMLHQCRRATPPSTATPPEPRGRYQDYTAALHAHRRWRARAIAVLARRMARQLAADLRGSLDAAAAAWRHHRELEALLRDERTARDLGLNRAEIAAALHQWWWRPTWRRWRDAAMQRRNAAIAAAPESRARVGGLRDVVSPALVPLRQGAAQTAEPCVAHRH